MNRPVLKTSSTTIISQFSQFKTFLQKLIVSSILLLKSVQVLISSNGVRAVKVSFKPQLSKPKVINGKKRHQVIDMEKKRGKKTHLWKTHLITSHICGLILFKNNLNVVLCFCFQCSVSRILFHCTRTLRTSTLGICT